MATPALRALRMHYGADAELIGVMRPYVRDVLAGTSWLNERSTVLYDRRSEHPEQRSWGVVRRLRAMRPDVLLYLTNSLRTALMGRLVGASRRVGYVRYGRGPLLTDRLRPPRTGYRLEPISAVDYYVKLIETLGVRAESRQTQLATTAADDVAAQRVWRQLQLGERGRSVAIISTGAAYGAAKQWPTEYFAALSRQLTEQARVDVLVICGPAERTVARQIAHLSGTPRVRTTADEAVSLALSKALIRRADLLVTNDSGPRHFGAAFNVPTITLFGPTDPRWSENYHPQEVRLSRPMACAPCGKRRCPLKHHNCMRELTADHVYRVAQQLLGDRRTTKVA